MVCCSAIEWRAGLGFWQNATPLGGGQLAELVRAGLAGELLHLSSVRAAAICAAGLRGQIKLLQQSLAGYPVLQSFQTLYSELKAASSGVLGDSGRHKGWQPIRSLHPGKGCTSVSLMYS